MAIEVLTNTHRPELAVQIVNYRTANYLPVCIETLLADVGGRGGGPKVEVYVADNASGEDLGDLEKRFKAAGNVHFQTMQENLGFGRAHNVLEETSGKTGSPNILILNPDIKFYEPDTVTRLVQRLESAERIKVVGPKLVDTSGNNQLYDHGNYLVDLNIGNFRINPYLFPLTPFYHDEKPTEVPWVSGAVFLAKRKAFQDAGRFDPNLFLYFEEVDLAQRIVRDGGAIIYDPTINVEHVGSVSTKDAKRSYFLQSFNYVVDKYHPKMLAGLLKALYKLLPDSVF